MIRLKIRRKSKYIFETFQILCQIFSEMKVTRRLRRKRKSGFGRSNGNEVTSGFDRHRLATSESESGSDQKSDDEQDSRPNKRDNRRESARKRFINESPRDTRTGRRTCL